MTDTKRILAGFALAGGLLAGTVLAMAQDANYPERPITLIVPFAPGGGGDLVGRAFNEELGQLLGQPVVIENHGGASAMIGAEMVTRARPDGYTLLLVNTTIGTNPAVHGQMNYRTPEDFTAIARIVTYPFVLAIRDDLPVDSVEELIAFARENPGVLTSGTSGPGSGQDLATRLLQSLAEIEVLDVPFSGAGPVVTALAGGHIDFSFAGYSLFEPLVDEGTVRLIGSTGLEPIGDPEIPTVASQGVEGFSYVLWWGVFAPADTPREIVDTINAALDDVLSRPEIQARLASLDGEIAVSTPEELDAFLAEELDRWQAVMADTGN